MGGLRISKETKFGLSRRMLTEHILTKPEFSVMFIMRKFTWFVMVIILFSFCSRQRDMSTPSSRLIGHWSRTYEITEKDVEKICKFLGVEAEGLKTGIFETHLYYDKIDSKTQIGSFISVDADYRAHYQYKIVSEQLEGEQMSVTVFSNGSSDRSYTFFIKKDGLTLIRKAAPKFEGEIGVIDTFQYVDNKNRP